MEYEGDVTPIVIGALAMILKGLIKGQEELTHPNYRIVEIVQNTEKSPGDFLSFKLQ